MVLIFFPRINKNTKVLLHGMKNKLKFKLNTFLVHEMLLEYQEKEIVLSFWRFLLDEKQVGHLKILA